MYSIIHLSDKGRAWLFISAFLERDNMRHPFTEVINSCCISLECSCNPGPHARTPAKLLTTLLLQVRSISSLVMSSCWGALRSATLHTTTPTGLSLKSSQGGYQYCTILLQHWNGLMENRGKSLRLHHGSKLSESRKSGKQMLNSGKPSRRPLLSESLGVKWTNTMHVSPNTVDVLRINVLKMLL